MNHGITAPSVDVERIARDEGIKVVREYANDRSISGFLDRRSAVPIIGVNRHHLENRQRFTIAHELGHHFLHSESLYFDDRVLRFRDAESSEGINTDEMEANLFAAELLMPKEFLEDYFSNHILDINDDEAIEDLAKEYKVSPQSLMYRLNYLDLA
ncbi:MAG TPA: ImmA/IrrE family metallo-endopeptidase [Pirellulales bacterium]|nr:ImmA/IrrE family metallo-endopeptidase [Pirellulales bacterium]